jgi:hypothetical protein
LRGFHAQVPQVFCRACGETYARDVASELYREVPEDMYANV